MKIIHPSGETFDLRGSELQMERLNPFFNELGDLSLPVTLQIGRAHV